MVRRLGWVAFALTSIALGFACFSIYQNYMLYTQGAPTGQQVDVPDADAAANAATDSVNFVANLQVADAQHVVLTTGGQIAEIAVEAGDVVEAGDLLLRLDPTNMAWNVTRAEIGLALARLGLEEQEQTTDDGGIAAAVADLLVAQEHLARLQAGPTAEELAAARASASAAWARYNELQADPSESLINQLRANLEKAQLARDQAQREYDKVSWRPDVGQTGQAAALQRATIDYNAALGAFEENIKPAAQSTLQSALAAAQQAQHVLNELEEGASEAELAVAKATVVAAETALEELRTGTGDLGVRRAELQVQQAEIDLEEAQLRLQSAQVTAPVAGVILALNVEKDQIASQGAIVATIGDINKLEIVGEVLQDDLARIKVGDRAEAAIFNAFTFESSPNVIGGEVAEIASFSQTTSGMAGFPVTIRLPESSLEEFRPGMLVSVTIFESSESP